MWRFCESGSHWIRMGPVHRRASCLDAQAVCFAVRRVVMEPSVMAGTRRLHGGAGSNQGRASSQLARRGATSPSAPASGRRSPRTASALAGRRSGNDRLLHVRHGQLVGEGNVAIHDQARRSDHDGRTGREPQRSRLSRDDAVHLAQDGDRDPATREERTVGPEQDDRRGRGGPHR